VIRFRPSRLAVPLAALAVLEVAAVAGIAADRPHGGALSVAVALLLAPIAIWCVLTVAVRLAGPRFGLAAGLVYLLLPFIGRFYFYGPFVDVYKREIEPALIGTRSTGWFALGVAIALALALDRLRVTAAAGAVALVVALVLWVDTDWTTLYNNFHETTWSPSLISLLPIACVLAVGLRSPELATALGGWIGFFILRGIHQPYADGGFWKSLAAATPAAALLLTSLALLVPPLGSLWSRGTAPARPPSEAR
jgi:hypothetical protein